MIFFALNKKLGIIGGGQLGKMMILEAKKMGIYVTVLDPTHNCPASTICDEIIVSEFNNKEAMLKLAQSSDIITYEFEHIGYEFLMELEEKGHTIYPSPKSLKIIQNKYTQKCILQKNGINVSPFVSIKNENDIKNIAKELDYPLLLKTCTGGYDGKGNFVIKREEEIKIGMNTLRAGGNVELMVEKFVDFSFEVSVLACGDINKNIKVYPVANNIHIDNILHKTIVPSGISQQIEQKAIKIAHRVIEIFSGVGMFCIEFFVTKTGDVLVNEVAPRPHNSGHYTIEGCVTSQFENHIRAVMSMPLGSTELINPTVMINLLGEENCFGKTSVEGVEQALDKDGVSLHIYGKAETKPKRKMGHITCSLPSIDKAQNNAEFAYKKLKILGTKNN